MLPVDIFDCIFSYLDIPSLEAISDAHPFFLSIAERHKYVNIVLTLTASQISGHNDSKLNLIPATLSNLLLKRPQIANYVLSITIDISPYYGLEIIPKKRYTHLEAIPPILALLQNLRKVTIEHRVEYFSGNTRWLELPESLRLSLENSLRLPSVREFNVKGSLEFPLPFLQHCKQNIKTLTLSECSISEMGVPSVDSDSSAHDGPCLKDLTIVGLPHSSLRILFPWMVERCKNLHSFTFSLDLINLHDNKNEPLLAIAPFLSFCPDTITTLGVVLSYKRQNYGCVYPCNFPSQGREILILPYLEEAFFYSWIFSPEDQPANAVSPFFVFTELLKIMPNLQRLSLFLNPIHVEIESRYHDDVEHAYDLDLLGADWSDLDSFLDSHGRPARFIIDLHMRIRTQGCKSNAWSDDDTKFSLMKYPNISRMVGENTLKLVISQSQP